MRLVFSGLLIAVGVLTEIVFVHRMYPDVNPFDWKLFGPWIVVLVVTAYFLFRERSAWVMKDGVLTYRRKDELVADTYHARRALELRDPESKDAWYLIELDTGKVLCLWDDLPSGPMGVDPANPWIRRFPCTEFTVLHHAVEKFTVQVNCAGEVIKPVTVSLHDKFENWLYAYLPEDGDFIPDKTFDEVQAELQKAIEGPGSGEAS
ncbi:MAG: hypothetical protein ABSF45_07700 [Terriglobia bacterium]|jgi:hypothetical protein